MEVAPQHTQMLEVGGWMDWILLRKLVLPEYPAMLDNKAYKTTRPQDEGEKEEGVLILGADKVCERDIYEYHRWRY